MTAVFTLAALLFGCHHHEQLETLVPPSVYRGLRLTEAERREEEAYWRQQKAAAGSNSRYPYYQHDKAGNVILDGMLYDSVIRKN